MLPPVARRVLPSIALVAGLGVAACSTDLCLSQRRVDGLVLEGAEQGCSDQLTSSSTFDPAAFRADVSGNAVRFVAPLSGKGAGNYTVVVVIVLPAGLADGRYDVGASGVGATIAACGGTPCFLDGGLPLTGWVEFKRGRGIPYLDKREVAEGDSALTTVEVAFELHGDRYVEGCSPSRWFIDPHPPHFTLGPVRLWLEMSYDVAECTGEHWWGPDL